MSETTRGVVWRTLIRLAKLEGADSFTIASGTFGADDPDLLDRVDVVTSSFPDEKGRRNLAAHWTDAAVVGVGVEEFDLYAGDDWIGGASDFGMDVAALLDKRHWHEFRLVLDGQGLAYFTGEIIDRRRPTIDGQNTVPVHELNALRRRLRKETVVFRSFLKSGVSFLLAVLLVSLFVLVVENEDLSTLGLIVCVGFTLIPATVCARMTLCRVVAGPSGIRIVNPVRTYKAWWSQIEDVGYGDVGRNWWVRSTGPYVEIEGVGRVLLWALLQPYSTLGAGPTSRVNSGLTTISLFLGRNA